MSCPINKYQQGHIAVISAVIITTILLVVSLVFSTSSFLGRFDTQVLEMKSITRTVAEGCFEHARLMLALGAYSGGETVTVSEYSCEVLPIESQAGETVIKTTSAIQNHTTNLKYTLNTYSLKIISVEEIGAF